jgi:hypothetical protein
MNYCNLKVLLTQDIGKKRACKVLAIPQLGFERWEIIR